MFNRYLVRAHCVLGAILEAGDRAASRPKISALMELIFWERTIDKQVSILKYSHVLQRKDKAWEGIAEGSEEGLLL